MTKEALKLALEALEVANSCVDGYYIPKGRTQLPEIELAITAIKEALAQQEQTPYITMPPSTPMWTIPLQRTWVGLTDEEVITMSRYDLEYAALIGEVQRRLKEKNT